MDYHFRNPNKAIIGNYNDRYYRTPTYIGSSGYMDGLIDTDEIIENVAEQLKQDGVFDSIIVDEKKIANDVVKYLKDNNLLGSTDQTAIINSVINKLKTDTDFLNSIKGEPGADGKDGKSPTASEVATQLKNDSSFKASVKGEPGKDGTSPSATDVATALKADSDFKASVKGEPGADGKDGTSPSASDVASELKADADFVAACKGEPGADTDAIVEVLKADTDFTDAIVNEVMGQLDGIIIEGAL